MELAAEIPMLTTWQWLTAIGVLLSAAVGVGVWMASVKGDISAIRQFLKSFDASIVELFVSRNDHEKRITINERDIAEAREDIERLQGKL